MGKEATYNEREIRSLISLLDDPDQNIFADIQTRLLSHGENAIPFLENAWENSFNDIFQKRIENLIHQIQFSLVYDGLKDWYLSGSKDLLKAFMLIAQYQYPDMDKEKVIKDVGKIIQDVWIELNNNLTALEKIKIINHVFYKVHGFTGNKQNFHAPQNSFINNILETKKGNPLSLSILYSVIALSLNVPIYGVNLPEHFILAYLDEEDFQENKDPKKSQVLFYINAFNKGTVFTINELQFFIRQMKLQPEARFFQPCDNHEIIRRVIHNLINSYNKLGYPEKVSDMENLLKAFSY